MGDLGDLGDLAGSVSLYICETDSGGWLVCLYICKGRLRDSLGFEGILNFLHLFRFRACHAFLPP